ncbi:hypothetical protein POX_b02492 [Penicillium oxalicum]|uniref:hypothetical protein n=1 Tax=Penicillium oxalicum TaxID=69781 RepID=UPI0020B8AEB5|nr:hypothetical protein POX_b02492 [Penicillium oxalicum]KAI2792454.1 hypothetical protein POX_b02492 [Penicillium oxalicum]
MPTVKPILPPLKTPKSASFPSEFHDDCPSSISDAIKQEEDSLTSKTSTPLTPQSAIPSSYLRFLEDYNSKSPLKSTSTLPSSQPVSALSGTFSLGDFARSPTVSLPPPTPLSAVSLRRNLPVPRRLRIPASLKYSPVTESPKSATSLRTPFSPSSDWRLRYIEPPRSASGKPVSVKQVVTRTVTYKRTHLDAPPKGKRRKCREGKDIKDIKEAKGLKESRAHQESKEVQGKEDHGKV